MHHGSIEPFTIMAKERWYLLYNLEYLPMYCQFFALELHIPPENIYFAVHSKRILTLEIISISYLSGIEYPREVLASISKV